MADPTRPNLTQPEQHKIDPTRPGSKMFDLDPSLVANDLFSIYACSVCFDSPKASTKKRFDAMFFRLLRIYSLQFQALHLKTELITRCKKGYNVWFG